jgi:Cu(I)/Ag(I) efflux system membrane protein CusA/SilA
VRLRAREAGMHTTETDRDGLIARVIEWCARNPVLTIVLVLLAGTWGWYSLRNAPLDAIPDLSDAQVIVFTEWPGRSPDLVEDQITYPISSTLLAAPEVKFVRGQSFFGLSFVYVIFEDGTDIYWARSRVLEYLNTVQAKLPDDVAPTLGPDATGVGWVFQYALVDDTGNHDLQQLRALQDWNLRYALESVEGVAEVATIGGYVKQYQVNVDPYKLASYGIGFDEVIMAVRQSNEDTGGRVLEIAGTEHMVRGLGYVRSIEDLENVPLMAKNGIPVRVKDVATVDIGADMKRGIAELNGDGEVVGGIVVMRYGENALRVIDAVKERIGEIEKGLPEGVRIEIVYDRSGLIRDSIATLRTTLVEEMIVVSLIIFLFLLHARSAWVAILTLPTGVLLAFIPMYYQGLTANIMSLGGIAVAIGAMVDASIILIENVHKKLEVGRRRTADDEEAHPERSEGSETNGGGAERCDNLSSDSSSPAAPQNESGSENRLNLIIAAMKEVGPSIFFSLLVITVSFMPVFTLTGTEGRLFKPLAYTKTYSMGFAAILAVTLTPALAALLIRGRIRREDENPINRLLVRAYVPVVRFVVQHRVAVIVVAILIMILTIPAFTRLGNEFMPPLNEGAILYMPTAPDGMSVAEATRVLQAMDRELKKVPEVVSVFGKMGRAETPTDPAPIGMAETTIVLKPRSEWRPGLTWDALIREMDDRMQFPGMPNVWWMPIQTRTEMLSTGVRSPLGIQVFADDVATIERVGIEIEKAVSQVEGTRSAFAERVAGGFYVDIEIDREQAARYGLRVADLNEIIMAGVGAMNVDETVEGRERYPIAVAFAREYRDEPRLIEDLIIPTPSGAQIPLGQVASVRPVIGPPMVRSEDGRLVGFVFVDTDRPIADYVKEARAAVDAEVTLPAGVRLDWVGQYEYFERAKAQLKVVVPVTLVLVLLLLYFNTKSMVETAIVLLAVPFSLVGAIWLLYLLDYNMSVAVWVGIIALAGLDAETGVVMLLYLKLAWKQRLKDGRLTSFEEMREAIVEGAAHRIRPKLMTVMTTMIGLLPVLWSVGTGADVMKRIAAPMVGGLVTSFLLELTVYPAVFAMWKGREVARTGDGG